MTSYFCIPVPYNEKDHGERPGGATPYPRSGAVAERSNSTSKERWLCGHRKDERSYSTFKVRRGDLVQGKEQWLRFAGAAVKRYSTSKVTETQVKMVGVKRGHQRADTLKPKSQKTSQSDHTDHSMV